MKQILAILFLFAGLSVASITDTIFVPVHVTDTIYVASPPDTVIIQKKPAFDNRDIDQAKPSSTMLTWTPLRPQSTSTSEYP